MRGTAVRNSPFFPSPHNSPGKTQKMSGSRKSSGIASRLCGIKPSCNGIVPGVTSSRPGGIGEAQPGLNVPTSLEHSDAFKQPARAEAVCRLLSVRPEDTREFGEAMRGRRHKGTGMGEDNAGPRICVDCTVQHEMDGRSMPCCKQGQCHERA
jgi:hypothetical protein